jgi:CheY-like chemotaxis protein
MELKPLHILLADDDEADRLLFKDAFAELALKTKVQMVKNGIELMEWLNKDDIRLPHLLFLDLNMPLKNGIECLKEIKSNDRLKNISIAIYSTSDNEKDMDETFLNGANIYITKPNDFGMLKQILNKAVSVTNFYEGNPVNRENFFLKI